MVIRYVYTAWLYAYALYIPIYDVYHTYDTTLFFFGIHMLCSAESFIIQTRPVSDPHAMLFPLSNFYFITSTILDLISILFLNNFTIQTRQVSGVHALHVQCLSPRRSDSYLSAQPFFCRQG